MSNDTNKKAVDNEASDQEARNPMVQEIVNDPFADVALPAWWPPKVTISKELASRMFDLDPPPDPVDKPESVAGEHFDWWLYGLELMPSPTLVARLMRIPYRRLRACMEKGPGHEERFLRYKKAIRSGREGLAGLAAELGAGGGFDYKLNGKGEIVALPRGTSEKILQQYLTIVQPKTVKHEHELNTLNVKPLNLTAEQMNQLDRSERKTLLTLITKATRPLLKDVTPEQKVIEHDG